MQSHLPLTIAALARIVMRAVFGALVSMCTITLLSSSHPAWAQWQGSSSVEDGVTHVNNPETPAEGEIDIELRELWRVGGDDEEILFGVIAQLVGDEEGNIYLLDSQLSEIQVFSPAGEYLSTIGRQGEGPGEFQSGFDLYRGPDGLLGVVQIFPGKIVRMTTDGDPADNYPLPQVDGGGFQLVYRARGTENRHIISGAYQRQGVEGQENVRYLKAFDDDGNEVAHYHYDSTPTQFGGMQFEEQIFSNFTMRWTLADDGRVASFLDFSDYTVSIWDAQGQLTHVIERPGYDPLERTDRQKKRFQRMFNAITSWNPGSSFHISDTHVVVNQMMFRDDGMLWVLPSRGTWERPDGVFGSFDVYDRQGRFTKRINLVFDGDPQEDAMFFVGDRVYVVTQLFSARLANMGGDEEEDMDLDPEPISVIAYEMREPIARAK